MIRYLYAAGVALLTVSLLRAVHRCQWRDALMEGGLLLTLLSAALLAPSVWGNVVSTVGLLMVVTGMFRDRPPGWPGEETQ